MDEGDTKSLLLTGPILPKNSLRVTIESCGIDYISQRPSGMSWNTDVDGPVWRKGKQNSCISLSDELT